MIHAASPLRQRSRFAPRALPLLALLTLTAGLASCGKDKAPAPTPPPPEVAVVPVELRTIAIRYTFVGMTAASKTVEIRARVPGFLLSRNFEEGKEIRSGDLLFQIDPRSFEADLAIAQARVAQAEARESLAQQEITRFTEAADSGAASRREVDQAQSELADAKASTNLAKAQLDKAELDLSYTKVLSPVTGTIGRALRDEGSYLEPSTNGLLANAQQTDPIYVVFSISEREWLKWKEEVDAGIIRANYLQPNGLPADAKDPNPPVSVSLLDGTTYDKPGRMNFFDSRVTPETGSATARAEFPNESGALLPGQFVRITVTGWERPDSIVVPQRAVIQNPGGPIVMVVNKDDTIEVRPVTLGLWKDDGWLIESGLKPGERVVADGIVRARPGSKVKPVPFVSAKEAAANAAAAPAKDAATPTPTEKPTEKPAATTADKK